MIANTDHSWGWLAKLFHWLMFVLIVGAIPVCANYPAYSWRPLASLH